MSNLLDMYARDVMKNRMVTKDEEIDLARRYQAGDLAAGQKLVASNLRYTLRVAHEYRAWGHRIEDLVQEANIGMMMALRKYNPERGYKFITYATWWIRAYVRGYLVRNATPVRFGTTTRERAVFGKLGAVLARLTHEHPGADETELYTLAADELSVDREELRIMHGRTRAGATLSLNRQMSGGNSTEVGSGPQTFQDLLEDETPSAEERLAEHADAQRVRDALYSAARCPRERYIVEKRLLSEDPLTLAELGRRLTSRVSGERLSRERVRQIEAGILLRARVLLERTH